MQWHPLFAQLLRALLQDYYEVETNYPVGDLPREADIAVIRRIGATPPFVGTWKHLTTWNVFEFKGPTDTPALRDLDLLIEVGLGVDRRLNAEREQQKLGQVDRAEVSWWYLANHVGQRLLAEAAALLGQPCELVADGLWRVPALGRLLWLVSRDRLAVDSENLPLHTVTQAPVERLRDVLAFAARQPALWHLYGPWLLTLNPQLPAEIAQMIQKIGGEVQLNFEPVVQLLGMERLIEQLGVARVIEQLGAKRVIEQLGPDKVTAAIGMERFLASLTPQQVQELRQRLAVLPDKPDAPK